MTRPGMYEDSETLALVDRFEKQMKVTSSQLNLEGFTTEDWKTAGHLFILLSICPSALHNWFVFYQDLFQTQSPDMILLTLNRMRKGTKTPQNEFFKNMAQEVFEKTTASLEKLLNKGGSNVSLIVEPEDRLKIEGKFKLLIEI